MDPLTFYTEQSLITNPGEYVELFADLPRNIADLCRIVQGVYIHYLGGALYNYVIPEERLSEINTRYVERMLARIIELDDRSLTEERPPEKRLVGCCRDAATLFCAMARHQEIPTRTRIGFADYLYGGTPDFKAHHEVAEYWDYDQNRWRLVDPEQDDLLIDKSNIQFDVSDIPRDRFIVAGAALQMCQAGEADPDTFGYNSSVKGLGYIGYTLVQDLAALNKREMLLWDLWGLMLKDEETLTNEELALLGKVASLTQAGNGAFSEIRAIYESEIGLKMPSVITSYSPLADYEPRQVIVTI